MGKPVFSPNKLSVIKELPTEIKVWFEKIYGFFHELSRPRNILSITFSQRVYVELSRLAAGHFFGTNVLFLEIVFGLIPPGKGWQDSGSRLV